MTSCLPLVLLGILLVGLLYPFVLLNVVALSFGKLGLTVAGGLLLLTISLVGGIVNLPVSRRRILVEPARRRWFFGFIYYHPPKVREQVLAVNVGGAIVPALFSAYLLTGPAPLLPTAAATAVVMVVARALARPIQGMGITMPAFVAPLTSAAAALLLAPHAAAPVAYVSGTVGTLIGADLLNLPAIRRMSAQTVSIGGAGVFDGVFLSGFLAVLLTG
ncbi:MAG: DUF1614 domain-containing protein [Chloroflexota bacterium]